MLGSELGARIADSLNGLSSQERMAFPLEIRKVKGQRITAEGEINGGHLLELNTESGDIHIDKR